jgi:hypothetical protein
MADWRKQIAIAHLVKKRVAELDVEGMWPHCLPEVAATPEQLVQVEALIGEPLDAKYREFLGFANGWKAFYHSVDLFGTDEFVSGSNAHLTKELLGSLEPLDQLCGLAASDVLPIAVSQDSIDLFVITRRHTQNPGEVIWFAGQVIDRFPNFDEYFLAMVDYNREDAKALGHE